MPRSLVLTLLLFAWSARADDGLVEVASSHDVKETVSRFEAALARAKVTVVAKVDHAAAAEKVGERLPPTVLLIFGSPKLGTPLMQCAPTSGLDLPLKALVRDDGKGRVTVTYSAPVWIAARHGGKGCDEVVKKMDAALRTFVEAATQ
ncbi:MAG: DUF302 domain-containing protein [Myxococcaceae bacterium]|nr:MAG: DUF302 domain-containing protein [Myxococcaceae bacterium]